MWGTSKSTDKLEVLTKYASNFPKEKLMQLKTFSLDWKWQGSPNDPYSGAIVPIIKATFK